uniref:Uncharacterized protein n=1 Tax=Pristionchus pacificus TaxID=54126 RepID=A0A2A6D1M2_PRIPA|eukprot:PDM84201.1 hypothetical protein PRIPAC_33224 [Pristionchus pacificus]
MHSLMLYGDGALRSKPGHTPVTIVCRQGDAWMHSWRKIRERANFGHIHNCMLTLLCWLGDARFRGRRRLLGVEGAVVDGTVWLASAMYSPSMSEPAQITVWTGETLRLRTFREHGPGVIFMIENEEGRQTNESTSVRIPQLVLDFKGLT